MITTATIMMVIIFSLLSVANVVKCGYEQTDGQRNLQLPIRNFSATVVTRRRLAENTLASPQA